MAEVGGEEGGWKRRGEEEGGRKRNKDIHKPVDFLEKIIDVWHVVQVGLRNAWDLDVHCRALDHSCFCPCRFPAGATKIQNNEVCLIGIV